MTNGEVEVKIREKEVFELLVPILACVCGEPSLP